MSADLSHLFDLPTADKLKLVEDLWDDIAAGTDPLPIPPWQVDELRRRKQLRSDDKLRGSNWEEVRQRVRDR
jgi:putative addiction module component (TIGR02574 family)